MIILEEIKKIALNNNACRNQLRPFIEFLRNGDERSCWEIVNGNIGWFKDKGLYTSLDVSSDLELLKMSDGIGKVYGKGGVFIIDIRKAYRNQKPYFNINNVQLSYLTVGDTYIFA